MNKRIKVASALAAALAVIVVLAWRPVGRTDKPAPQRVVATEAPPPSVQQGKTRVPVARAPAGQAPEVASEWRQFLTGNIDALQFVKAAVPAAKAGDGRAMWYIGQMLHMCIRAFNDIRGGTPLSFEAQLQQDLAQMHPNMPQYLKDEHERGARRCFPLFELGKKENPWGGPPQMPEQWLAQAIAAGDPLAQVDVAARAVADLMADAQMPEDVRAAKVKAVQDNLRAAVESSDPDALYGAGMLVATNGKYTFQGLAVALAACDLGRDCTAANPESGFYECVQWGRCPPGLDFPSLLQQGMGQEQYAEALYVCAVSGCPGLDFSLLQRFRQVDDALASVLQQGMGQEQYAQVYARSRQVVQLARAGDYQGVLAYLTQRQASPAR
jgi:hypothetical protein